LQGKMIDVNDIDITLTELAIASLLWPFTPPGPLDHQGFTMSDSKQQDQPLPVFQWPYS
jgi:hypothetical protein